MSTQGTFRSTVRPLKKRVAIDFAGVLDFSGRATSLVFTSGQSLPFSSIINEEHLIEGQTIELINSQPSNIYVAGSLMEDGIGIDVEPNKISILVWTSNQKFFDVGGTAYTKNVEDAVTANRSDFDTHTHDGTDSPKILAEDLDASGATNGQVLQKVAGFPAWVSLDDELIDWTEDQGATNIHPGNYTDTTDHTALSNIGVNSHAQIDTHIQSALNPHNTTKSQVGLGEVDNTADADKPVSIAQQAALDLKYNLSNPLGFLNQAAHDALPADNPHSVTKAQVGLSEVPNVKVNLVSAEVPGVSDDTLSGYSVGSRWINQTLDREYVCLDSSAGAAVWKETTQIPGNPALNDVTDVIITGPIDNEVLAYNSGTNRWINQTASEAGLYSASNPDSFLNETSHDALPQDNPHGVTKEQVGLGNADNTSDINKPVSTTQQEALDLKADDADLAAHINNTTNPHSVTKAQVGLSNVLNTLNNFNGANAPTSTDDSTQGYSIGSEWIDLIANKKYTCVDSAISGAIWEEQIRQAELDLKYNASNPDGFLTEATHDLLPADNPHNVTKAQVGLSNVNNTADADKPISIATQTALNSKYDNSNPSNFLTEAAHDGLPSDNPHGVTKAQVGLGNADNTSDLNKPVSTAQQTALDLKYDVSNPAAYLHEDAHDSLPFDNPHNVNKAQVGLGNADNTSDVNKPISTAQQAALDLKYNANNPANYLDSAAHASLPSNNPHNVTKTQVGLSNVDNTSDANKPVSTAQQTALNLKYDATNPSNYLDQAAHNALPSNNPHGVTKSQVGLGNVENILHNRTATSDPTITNSSTGGYSVGSHWLNTTNDRDYICLNATPGAAKWEVITSMGLKDIKQEFIGDPVESLSHLENHLAFFHSAGRVSGGIIIDDGDGTITVTSGTGIMRETSSPLDPLLAFSFAEESGANVALTSDSLNYVYAEYNGGSPRVVTSTTNRTDRQSSILLGRVYKNGGTDLHIDPYSRQDGGDHATKMLERMWGTMPFARESGGILNNNSDLTLLVTSGVWWEGFEKFTTPQRDTSASDTFKYHYLDGLGGWSQVDNQTEIDNQKYDDGSGTLANLVTNEFGVHWVYMDAHGHLDVIYGSDSYANQQDAQDALMPSSVPLSISSVHRLIGKIIVQQGASTLVKVESVFTSIFTGGSGAANSHTELLDIGVNSHAQIDTHLGLSNNPHNTTKAHVGLSNVDNTSDALKPISIAQQTALDLKYDANNPDGFLNETSHDGLPQDNPHGVTKAQVGLGNADNTSDANKPVSTAQQAALDLKYNANNPEGYETPAQLNSRDTNNRSRNNHTGTQIAATISDFDTEVANNSAVVLNTAKVSNATHTGEVTGDTALTIANNVVTYAKMQDISTTNRILGRNAAGAGDVQELTPASVRTMINVAEGANNYVHPNHTGEVTSTGDGAQVVQPVAVSNKPGKTVLAGTEELLINDAGTLRKTTVEDVSIFNSIANITASATAQTSTTSTTMTQMANMTTTPPAGTYLATFSSSGYASTNGATVNYQIAVNGTPVDHSNRRLLRGGGTHTGNTDLPLHTQAVVTVNGSQAVAVNYSTTSGTVTIYERSLILLKLSN